MSQIGTLIQTLAKGGPVMIPLEVLHGRVLDVMDAARLAGVGKLAIAMTPREAGR